MRRRLVIILLAVVGLLAGCEYGDPGTATQTPSNSYGLIGFTADVEHPGDSFSVAGDWATTVISAPASNQGGNTRIGFIVDSADLDWNETCATWHSHTGQIDQPGHVLHFNGRYAITVTQNIYALARNVINVHLWDLAQPATAGRFTLLTQWTPPAAANEWPLRSCARAYGSTIRHKIWPTSQPEPPWGDACCTSITTVTYAGPGRAGWFAGHLQPGGAMVYDDLYLHAI